MNLMPFQELPFNGDDFICLEFLKLKETFNIDTAIETGSCIYTTTKWLCDNFNDVWTVEINPQYAEYGQHKVSEITHLNRVVGVNSIDFINDLKNKLTKDKVCIFFLDAHWGENCPLLDELKGIANLNIHHPPIIAIHDFYTNHPEELGYDTYKGEALSHYYIMDAIKMLEIAYGCSYHYYYNTPEKSLGAKRGIIYLTPKF